MKTYWVINILIPNLGQILILYKGFKLELTTLPHTLRKISSLLLYKTVKFKNQEAGKAHKFNNQSKEVTISVSALNKHYSNQTGEVPNTTTFLPSNKKTNPNFKTVCQ